ncbi:hypothetical protein [Streptomyces sp. 2A115]|uniref:hypothetical protein n=1 Tax=Streptomyces sp. 2A115 TaxID=3457439 RepID=UPI003FD190A3
MPEGTIPLARLRARMLATAFSNADLWTRRSAFLTDQAVAGLAPCDRGAAETLDCPACDEAQDQCRYHAGFFAGMEYQRDLIQRP